MSSLAMLPEIEGAPDIIFVGAFRESNFLCDEKDLLEAGPNIFDISEQIEEILNIDLKNYQYKEFLIPERKFIKVRELKKEFKNFKNKIFIKTSCEFDAEIEEIYLLDDVPDNLEVVLYSVFFKE